MIYFITIFFHVSMWISTTTTDVHLSFGRRTGCIGSGICAIEKPNNYFKSTYDASGTIEVVRDHIVLKINKNSISVADAQTQFKENTFTMEEKLPLSESLSSAIGVDRSQHLSSGAYAITESKDTYEITFVK